MQSQKLPLLARRTATWEQTQAAVGTYTFHHVQVFNQILFVFVQFKNRLKKEGDKLYLKRKQVTNFDTSDEFRIQLWNSHSSFSSPYRTTYLLPLQLGVAELLQSFRLHRLHPEGGLTSLRGCGLRTLVHFVVARRHDVLPAERPLQHKSHQTSPTLSKSSTQDRNNCNAIDCLFRTNLEADLYGLSDLFDGILDGVFRRQEV